MHGLISGHTAHTATAATCNPEAWAAWVQRGYFKQAVLLTMAAYKKTKHNSQPTA